MVDFSTVRNIEKIVIDFSTVRHIEKIVMDFSTVRNIGKIQIVNKMTKIIYSLMQQRPKLIGGMWMEW